jgi:hypothetical protein
VTLPPQNEHFAKLKDEVRVERLPPDRPSTNGAGRHESKTEGASPSDPPKKADKPVLKAVPFEWVDSAKLPRRQWLYGRHLIRKFMSCTLAPGGLGKSSMEIVEALAMATGRNLRSAGVAQVARLVPQPRRSDG